MATLYPNIDRELYERNMTYHNFAEALNMAPMNVYRRLTGITQWSLSEVIAVCLLFERDDALTLFLRLHNKT